MTFKFRGKEKVKLADKRKGEPTLTVLIFDCSFMTCEEPWETFISHAFRHLCLK